MREVTLDKTGAPHSAIDRLHLVNACPLLSGTDKAVLNYVALRHNAKKGWVDAEAMSKRFSGEVVIDETYGYRRIEGEKTHVHLYAHPIRYDD